MAYGSSLPLRDAHVAARGRARSPHAWDGVPRRIGGIVTLKYGAPGSSRRVRRDSWNFGATNALFSESRLLRRRRALAREAPSKRLS